MSIDLSAIHLGPFGWLAVLIIVLLVIFGVFRFFFHHLIHLLFRGCGLILLAVALLYVLHLLKLI
ncbi:MAG TPA: hypothetical protein VMJ64_15760 [Anaerolineales bacterium]|nr:hypothetical protein [Anaerolineales bacterium]